MGTHTRTYRHHPVTIRLRDGTIIEDHFLERRRNGYIRLKRHGKLHRSQIQSFTAHHRKPPRPETS